MKVQNCRFKSYNSWREGTHKDDLDKVRKNGFTRVRVNGEIRDLNDEIELDKNKGII